METMVQQEPQTQKPDRSKYNRKTYSCGVNPNILDDYWVATNYNVMHYPYLKDWYFQICRTHWDNAQAIFTCPKCITGLVKKEMRKDWRNRKLVTPKQMRELLGDDLYIQTMKKVSMSGTDRFDVKFRQKGVLLFYPK